MSKVSTARKLGVVARLAGQQAGRSRIFTALTRAVGTTLRSFANVLHQLWLEVMGVLFLIMALSFTAATFKEYGKYQAAHAGSGRLVIAACGALTFAWFGLSSFWRVRKKSQRP